MTCPWRGPALIFTGTKRIPSVSNIWLLPSGVAAMASCGSDSLRGRSRQGEPGVRVAAADGGVWRRRGLRGSRSWNRNLRSVVRGRAPAFPPRFTAGRGRSTIPPTITAHQHHDSGDGPEHPPITLGTNGRQEGGCRRVQHRGSSGNASSPLLPASTSSGSPSSSPPPSTLTERVHTLRTIMLHHRPMPASNADSSAAAMAGASLKPCRQGHQRITARDAPGSLSAGRSPVSTRLERELPEHKDLGRRTSFACLVR